MAIITEDYVSLETAKLLKEKGFGEPTIGTYNIESKNPILIERPIRALHCEAIISAPTFQMAMKWLREVHNIDIIAPPQYDSIKWTYSAIIFKLSIPCTEIRLNDNKDKKEEAYETAIKYCLEHLI